MVSALRFLNELGYQENALVDLTNLTLSTKYSSLQSILTPFSQNLWHSVIRRGALEACSPKNRFCYAHQYDTGQFTC